MTESVVLLLYGLSLGVFFGFAFAIALDEVRLKRIMKSLKEENPKK